MRVEIALPHVYVYHMGSRVTLTESEAEQYLLLSDTKEDMQGEIRKIEDQQWEIVGAAYQDTARRERS